MDQKVKMKILKKKKVKKPKTSYEIQKEQALKKRKRMISYD